MASAGVVQRGYRSGLWSRSLSLFVLEPLSYHRALKTQAVRTMSFQNSHFVAGHSDGEDDSSVASPKNIETINGANLLLEPMRQVDQVVASCLKGIAKVPLNIQDTSKGDVLSKRMKPSTTSSDTVMAQPLSSARTSSASDLSTSNSTSMTKMLSSETEHTQSTLSANAAVNSLKKETELEKQLRLRAQRFGIYSAVQQTISSTQSVNIQTREFSTKSESATVALDGALVSSSTAVSTHPTGIQSATSPRKATIVTTGKVTASTVGSPSNVSPPPLIKQLVTPAIESLASNVEIGSRISLNTSAFPPLPMRTMARISSILRRGDYNARVTEAARNQVHAILGEYKYVISDEALRSMRHTLLADRAMMVHSRLSQKEIAKRYESGESLESIAKSYSAPAFACLRLVLRDRGLSPKFIKDAIAGRIPLETRRDIVQRNLAAEMDTTTAELDDRLGASLLFEQDIAQYLQSRGIKFKTQHDMKGMSLTPDFLIDESTPLFVGSRKITWIDAKNFFGGVSKNHIAKINKQAHKYAAGLGPGAIIFSMGFCDELVDKVADEKVAMYDFRWFVSDYVAKSDTNAQNSPIRSASVRTETLVMTEALPASSSTVSETITGVKRSAPDEESEQKPVKRIKFNTSDDLWNHVFAAIRAVGFTGQITEELVNEVNELVSGFDPDSEPFTIQHVELIHHDMMSDLRQEIERSKDVRSPVTQKRYLKLFNSGTSALEIATSEFVPPLLVIRNILEARGVSEKDVERISKPTITLSTLTSMMVRDKILREREVEDLAQIVEQNLFFYPPEQAQFEHSVMQFLQSVNVQVTLREQPWRHVVLNSDLTIEGRAVKWVLTSDNFGGASKRHTARLKSIVGTLLNTIGPGAVVFSCGFSDKNLLEGAGEGVVLVDFRLLTLA